MIKVFELNRGVYRVELESELLESLEAVVLLDKYTAEQVLAVLIYSVLRLDNNNLLFKE